MGTVSPLGVKKMSWNYIVLMVAQCVKCGGSHRIVDLIMVQVLSFMLCEFYFKKVEAEREAERVSGREREKSVWES